MGIKNSKEEIKMKALLVYLLLGNDNIISTSFKVLNWLISDENMEKNRNWISL